MKIRSGFVSNSSSSSFIVYKRSPELTPEQRKEISKQKITKYFGDKYIEDYMENVKEDEVVLTVIRYPDNDEGISINDIVNNLITSMGIDSNNFRVGD